MKYKLITKMTDEEIEILWKDIFNINRITNIERREETNEIEVSFETTWGNDNEEPFEVEDTITMYSDDFDEPDFSTDSEDRFKYKQYMIAKGYSKYWKDNKYADEN